MKDSFQIRAIFPVKASAIYRAWLNSKSHSEMTGSDAKCTNYQNGTFAAWDGYIQGRNIKLIPDKEIIQHWRTTDFAQSDEDSEIIITLNETMEGCELVLTHNNIPKLQPDYKQGWFDFYFTPMMVYFKTE